MRNFVINNRRVFFLLIFSILIAFGVWTIDEVISILGFIANIFYVDMAIWDII